MKIVFVDEGQKLFVRLFGRKFKWIIKSKIKYPKIAEDLSDTLLELVASGLLHDGKFTLFINIFTMNYEMQYIYVQSSTTNKTPIYRLMVSI